MHNFVSNYPQNMDKYLVKLHSTNAVSEQVSRPFKSFLYPHQCKFCRLYFQSHPVLENHIQTLHKNASIASQINSSLIGKPVVRNNNINDHNLQQLALAADFVRKQELLKKSMMSKPRYQSPKEKPVPKFSANNNEQTEPLDLSMPKQSPFGGLIFDCFMCDILFESQEELDIHIINDHRNSLKKKLSLNSHIESKPSTSLTRTFFTTYSCPVCNVVFMAENQLHNHLCTFNTTNKTEIASAKSELINVPPKPKPLPLLQKLLANNKSLKIKEKAPRVTKRILGNKGTATLLRQIKTEKIEPNTGVNKRAIQNISQLLPNTRFEYSNYVTPVEVPKGHKWMVDNAAGKAVCIPIFHLNGPNISSAGPSNINTNNKYNLVKSFQNSKFYYASATATAPEPFNK